jgi:hypothetical protein
VITVALLLLGLLSLSKVFTEPLYALHVGLLRKALGNAEFGALIVVLAIFWIAAARYVVASLNAAVKSEFAKGYSMRPVVFVPPALAALVLAYLTWGIFLVFSPMFTMGDPAFAGQFMFIGVLACAAFVFLLAVGATAVEWVLKRVRIDIRLLGDGDALTEPETQSGPAVDAK